MQNTRVFIISRLCGHQTRSHMSTLMQMVLWDHWGFVMQRNLHLQCLELLGSSWSINATDSVYLLSPGHIRKCFFCCESCLNNNHSAKQHVSSVFIPAIWYKGWKVEDLDLPPTFPVLLKSSRKLSLFIMTQFNGLLRFILQFVLKRRCFDGLWISASDFIVTCFVLIFNIFGLTIKPAHINCLLSTCSGLPKHYQLKNIFIYIFMNNIYLFFDVRLFILTLRIKIILYI